MAQHVDRFCLRVERDYRKGELAAVKWRAAVCPLVLFSIPVTGH